MHIEHYAEFIVLTEELNFHTAAERLHISQSAFSKHIAELERHHHVQLLERDRSSVRLTAKGAVFLEQAAKISDLHAELVRLFDTSGDADRPLYIAGVMDNPIDYPLVSRSFDHCRENGLDRLPVFLPCESVSIEDQADLLRRGEADCSLIFTSEHLVDSLAEQGEFATRKIYRIPMDAVVSTDHPLAKHASLSLEDLANETIIRPVGPRFTTVCEAFDEQLVFAGVNASRKLITAVSSYDQVTADPKGAILPVQRTSRFAAPMQNSNAVRIPIKDDRLALQLTAIYPIGMLSRKLEVFFDSLEKTYREGYEA